MFATLALASLDATACPLDEGGTMLFPGGRSAFTGEVLPLPSQPSLYYVEHYDGDDPTIEAESNGQPVPFTIVDISVDGSGASKRIDFAIESGPLVVHSNSYRSFTFHYRVVPGYTPSHAATLELGPFQYGMIEYADIESEAGLYRIDRAGYSGPSDQRAYTEDIYPRSGDFRVTAFFSDRTTAVIYDRDAALVGVIVDTARFARAWLPSFERQPEPPPPTWPQWLALALLLVACSLVRPRGSVLGAVEQNGQHDE